MLPFFIIQVFKPDCICSLQLSAMVSSNDIYCSLLQAEVDQDAGLLKIKEQIGRDADPPFQFNLINDKLFFKGYHVLSKASSFVPLLLKEQKTYLRLAAE